MKAATTLVVLMPLEKPPAASARFRFVAMKPGEPLRLPRLRSREVIFIRGRHRDVEHTGMALRIT